MKRSRRKASMSLAPLALVAGLVLILGVGVAYTATNEVPPTSAGDQIVDVLPQTSSPPGECSGITTTSGLLGTNVITGTDSNDWIVGSEAVDTIDGLGGDDCIEGKGAADVIHGGLGNDVCVGGAGIDTFVGCETEIQ